MLCGVAKKKNFVFKLIAGIGNEILQKSQFPGSPESLGAQADGIRVMAVAGGQSDTATPALCTAHHGLPLHPDPGSGGQKSLCQSAVMMEGLDQQLQIEGTVGQGMQVGSASWKRQGRGFSPRASTRTQPCQH